MSPAISLEPSEKNVKMKRAERIERLKITGENTLGSALEKMDALCVKLLLVADATGFHGVLSIGDVQRALIRGVPLSGEVRDNLRKDFRSVSHLSLIHI